jgi:hypothetical protein
MQKSAVKLSGQLLQAIISSDIYEAVLHFNTLARAEIMGLFKR